MADTSRPLHPHQQRALAAAAGLVGRPRLRTGLALTLAFACGPVGDADDTSPAASSTGGASDSGAADTFVTDIGASDSGAAGTLLTDSASDGSAGASTTQSGSSDSGSADTLLTDAGTTLATTGEPTTGGTDTGDSSGEPGTTGGLEDCILDRVTMEIDWACCEAQQWLPQPQCTPWGPPAPPIAGARLDLARRARRGLA